MNFLYIKKNGQCLSSAKNTLQWFSMYFRIFKILNMTHKYFYELTSAYTFTQIFYSQNEHPYCPNIQNSLEFPEYIIFSAIYGLLNSFNFLTKIYRYLLTQFSPSLGQELLYLVISVWKLCYTPLHYNPLLRWSILQSYLFFFLMWL